MATLYQADVALAGCRPSCCLTDAAAPGLGRAVVQIPALGSQGSVPQPSPAHCMGCAKPQKESSLSLSLCVCYIPDTRGVFLPYVPDSASGGEPAV